ncbi:MAG: hypothetical protein N2170_01975 [Bacteroidia bacterium]|nr:hypothetical protein [Bacteroidia bacterium]
MSPKVFLFLAFLVGCQSTSQKSESRNAVSSQKRSDSPPTRLAVHPYWTDLSRLLGGIPPKDTLYWRNALRDSAWKVYAQRLSHLWEVRKKALYDSLSPWAARELEPYHEWKGTVFYPFSGADWPTLYYVYPKGNRYVFFGLEQEGDPHELSLLSPQDIARNLQGTLATLGDLLRLSFFKTKDMQVQLAHGKVRGLLPVFLALFARTGHSIYSVQHIYLKNGGTIDTLKGGTRKPPQSAWDDPITGLRFEIGLPNEPVQEVIYLSLNAANSGIERQTGSKDFLSSLRPCVTLIKSASYLLFGPDFSEMRRLILSQSVALLQEDTGIPYRYFDTAAWRVQLYGVYHQPIALFRSKYQNDLWQAYRTYPVRRLPFTIGYHTVPGQSNLLWAVRRDPQAALPPLPEEASPSKRPLSPLPPLPAPVPPSDTASAPSPPQEKRDTVLPISNEAPSNGSE